MWKCANCGEQVDDNFETCWNCQTVRAGVSSESYFSPPIPKGQNELRDRITSQSTDALKKVVTVDGADYRDEAIQMARAELKLRGVTIDGGSATPPSETAPHVDAAAYRADQRIGRVLDRYTDAYRIARFLVTLGTLIKIVGAIFGALIAFTFISFAGYVSTANLRGQQTDGAEAAIYLVAFLWGGAVFIVFFIAGVIISAQGQILKANLDAAVHTSPFVNDDEKAQIMSLD